MTDGHSSAIIVLDNEGMWERVLRNNNKSNNNNSF